MVGESLNRARYPGNGFSGVFTVDAAGGCIWTCTRCTRGVYLPCSVPVSPARPCHGDAQRAPRKGGRGTGSWQTASPENRDQWRARIKAPLNFNGFCAMPLYLPHYFLAIKSAHSALPYATRLKTHASRRKSPLLRANSPLSTARAHTSCLPSLEPSLSFPSNRFHSIISNRE